jgi:hypothetical protein
VGNCRASGQEGNMTKTFIRTVFAPLLLGLLGLAFTAGAWADPPSRVARLAYVSGAASFSPGGERDWARAVINRPLMTGDRLWVDRGARAELQLGSAAIRIGGATSLTLLSLDDRTAQVELAQGILNIRVRRLDRGQVFEIDTPTLAYSIRRPGSYRIQVDADSGETTVMVRSGMAEVYGDGRAFIINDRLAYRFFDTSLRDYRTFARWPLDEFDRWSSERDRRWDNSPSRRYVSTEVIGYADLDSYGTWRQSREYGNVWVPNRVPADWAPYRDGHWVWVEPWGWTWIDDAPWGFAPSHYGRWTHLDAGWAWVPGPATARPVYAPALVAFVDGGSLRAPGGAGAVGWFPLAPREVYRPSYTTSREYFYNVNVSNTVVNRTVVTQYYGNASPANVTYANQQVPGAVIAVLAAAFAQSRPVAKETVRASRDMLARAPVVAVAPVAPVHASVVGPAPAAPDVKPPENVRRRPVVAQVAPPAPPVPFAARQSALAANPGKPLDAAAVAALKPATPASAPAVKVVEATQPVAAPAKPASAPAPARTAPASSAAAGPQAPASAASAAAPGPRGRASGPRGERPSPRAPASTASSGPPAAAAPAREAASARANASGPVAPPAGGAASAAGRAGPPPFAPASPRASGEPSRGRPETIPRPPQAAPAPTAPTTAPAATPAVPATPATPAPAPTPRASAAPSRGPQGENERGRGRPADATPAAPSAAAPATAPAPAASPAQANEQSQRAREAQQRQPEAQRRPASAPAATAAAPAAAAAPASAAAEQRGPRGRPDNAGAAGRREGASDARRGDERQR